MDRVEAWVDFIDSELYEDTKERYLSQWPQDEDNDLDDVDDLMLLAIDPIVYILGAGSA